MTHVGAPLDTNDKHGLPAPAGRLLGIQVALGKWEVVASPAEGTLHGILQHIVWWVTMRCMAVWAVDFMYGKRSELIPTLFYACAHVRTFMYTFACCDRCVMHRVPHCGRRCVRTVADGVSPVV